MGVGSRVKDLRKEREFTQGDLAERSGLSKRTIANVELGNFEPRLQTLQQIAIALGLKSIKQLLE